MIEAKVVVPREIIIEGLAKSRNLKSLLLELYAASSIYFMAWSVVVLVDVVTNNTHLILWHLLALAVLSVVVSLRTYSQYKDELKSKAKSVEYFVKLDDSGVYISHPKKHYGWEEYQCYIEHDKYLQLMGRNTGVSFLPKTDELSEVIEYTKSKIPNK